MNQNSLLALVTLIALLWINGGDCLKGRQNENEVDIAKRQKDVNCPAPKYLLAKYCWRLKKCIKQGPVVHIPRDNKYDEYDYDCYAACDTAVAVMDARMCCKQACCKRPFKCYIEPLGLNPRGNSQAEDEMADEDEADEAKSDEVDIAKRQKGLKILKAWKRDEAEMAAVDEADEDKAQN